MASIDKRADGRYRARWREYPGGPQKTRQFARKGDAERFLDAIRGDLAHGVDRWLRPSRPVLSARGDVRACHPMPEGAARAAA